jgi:hypothetical protein
VPFAREHQAAFSRAVTDAATSDWICDVFVNAHQHRRWLGTWLAQSMVDDLAIEGAALLLAPKDAPGVCRRCGFTATQVADRWRNRSATCPRRWSELAELGAQETGTPGRSAAGWSGW